MYKQLFSVCLLGFVVWHLAHAGFKTSQFFTSSTITSEGVCQLDSFSEPSVAASILKQEAERLLGAYAQSRDQKAMELPQNVAQQGDPQGTNRNPSGLAGFECSAPFRSTIEPLEKLHRNVQELNGDLDRKLMLVYYQNRRSGEFLDCYLHFFRAEPENAQVLTWAWSALGCAESCQRTDEVLDEFEHLLKYHPNFKTARGLKSTVAEWKTMRIRNADSLNHVDVSERSGPGQAPKLEATKHSNIDLGRR
jgi:hypothetical protein